MSLQLFPMFLLVHLAAFKPCNRTMPWYPPKKTFSSRCPIHGEFASSQIATNRCAHAGGGVGRSTTRTRQSCRRASGWCGPALGVWRIAGRCALSTTQSRNPCL
eukprot:1961454-Karenia_brevis.AAC.1